jgi:hypothetical protein
MRTRTNIKIIIGVIATAALVAVPTAGAVANLHVATLSGSEAFPTVSGKAKFSVERGGREFDAQIQNAGALAGTRVEFRVDGKSVGSAAVSSAGVALIRLSRSAAPRVSTGFTSEVLTSSGVLVASGVFN